jgi:hypothetical protein
MDMKRALYIASALVVAAWLPGCANLPLDEELADCPAGKKDVKVKYGDSYLEVDAKIDAKPDEALVFQLMPRTTKGPNGLDYDTVQVTIKGKSGGKDASWIDVSGTAAEAQGKQLIECVPDAQSEGTYYYLVTVEKVGALDPRVEVTR